MSGLSNTIASSFVLLWSAYQNPIKMIVGVVASFRPDTKEHCIAYDEGTEEALDLTVSAKERVIWRLEKPKQQQQQMQMQNQRNKRVSTQHTNASANSINTSNKRQKRSDTESTATAAAPSVGHAHANHGQMVGCVEVLWPGDGVWYDALVVDTLPNGHAVIHYANDGTEETVDPEKIKWRAKVDHRDI